MISILLEGENHSIVVRPHVPPPQNHSESPRPVRQEHGARYSGGDPGRSEISRAGRIGIILISFLLGLFIMWSPRVPRGEEVDTAADVSWSAVLGYAHQHGLQYGQDIVFTYGPLGFLATPFAAAGDQIGLRLFTDALLALAVGSAITLVAWKLGTVWKWFLLATSVFLLGNISPRTDLLIELGLLFWGLLVLVEEGPRVKAWLGMFLVVAVFAALVKVTLMILAILGVVLIGLDLLVRGYRRLALGSMAIFVVGFLGSWIGLGQAPSHLGLFISRALATSRGYNQAMGYEGSLELRWRGAFTAFACVSTILARGLGGIAQAPGRVLWRRLLLVTWTLAMLFLVWKHGFVRTDLYHAGFWFGCAPMLVLGLEVIPVSSPGARFWARASSIICCFVGLITAQAMVLRTDFKSSLLQPVINLKRNSANLLVPATHVQRVQAAMAEQRERGRLPGLADRVGRAGIDMFGSEQTAVLFSGLNYHPRPVFQSYAAYSASLMEWNDEFYLSLNAPEYVLFRLSGLDRKFPPLADSRALRNLLINYQPTATDGTFLLLNQRHRVRADLKLISQGALEPGEKLRFSEFSDLDLWVAFDLQPTLPGRARAFLYQPPIVRLVLWYGSADKPKVRRFRAPATMLAAGFLISPLLFGNDDVVAVYRGDGFLRPSACAIVLDPGTERLWKDSIGFHVYKVESKLGRCGTPWLQSTKFLDAHSTGIETNASRAN